MPGLKPAYLISGDDDAKIDAWRARVRRRAEEENGPGGLEIFDATSDPPEAVATALTTLTFATGGDRYLLADNVEAWKAGELDPLERELAAIPEGTVLVLIARGKPPAQRLAKAVEKAGGELREYAAPKPWEMPKWAIERAAEEGLQIDPEGAKALVAAGRGGRGPPAADRPRGRAAGPARAPAHAAVGRPGAARGPRRGPAAGLRPC